jgi:predicted DsbA family dithiol-disulfide isomerase
MSEGERALTIDVVSDVVCPWCYLGKRHVALALAQGDGGPVAVRWRPYQLDPTIRDEVP